MLAGGTDAAIIPSGVAGFISCKALSKRNEDPTRASRPWDRQRDGFIIGEGAGWYFTISTVVQMACSSAPPQVFLPASLVLTGQRAADLRNWPPLSPGSSA